MTEIRVILSVILKIIFLKCLLRTLTEMIERKTVNILIIDSSISHFSIQTVEVKFSKAHQHKHDIYYFSLVEKMKKMIVSKNKRMFLFNELFNVSEKFADHID